MNETEHVCTPSTQGWIYIENKVKMWRSKCPTCAEFCVVPIAEKPGRVSQRPYTGAWLGKPSLCDALDRAMDLYGHR